MARLTPKKEIFRAMIGFLVVNVSHWVEDRARARTAGRDVQIHAAG
jgi:hypothetical protein